MLEPDQWCDAGASGTHECAESTNLRLQEVRLLRAATPFEETLMESLLERCAGLDVHKDTVVACVPVPGQKRQHEVETRSYGATTRELLALRDGLVEQGVQVVGMEATGSYLPLPTRFWLPPTTSSTNWSPTRTSEAIGLSDASLSSTMPAGWSANSPCWATKSCSRSSKPPRRKQPNATVFSSQGMGCQASSGMASISF